MTKEECLEALAHLDLMSCCRFCQGIDCKKCKFNPKQDHDCGYRKAVNILEELIWEHFEPVELLKKHELKKVEKPSLLINEEFVESKEMVDHPSHYNQGKREVIEEMRILFGDDAVESFCRLNAYKYLRRAEFKGNKKEDLDKADWYMDYIEKMRGER